LNLLLFSGLTESGIYIAVQMEVTAESEHKEERKLVKRWPQPIPAIVALVLTLVVFYAPGGSFRIPRGWMRMYTPYVGYMYTRWWLIMLIWMVYIFNYWPFKRLAGRPTPPSEGRHPDGISVVILWVLIKGFFEIFVGQFRSGVLQSPPA
jgi:amino acid transporter, AAT family